MKVGKKVLGLAIGQKSILVAEVTAKEQQYVASNFGEFVFPEGVLLSAPTKLGEALAQFLKDKHFSTRDAVIGFPAKRLVTRRKELPAAPAALAASTLRLQAEGEFSSELDNLIMDFAGTPSAAEATTVLLMATNKVAVDECMEMARVAGVRVHAVTSTGAALGRATSKIPDGGELVLNLGPTSAELIVQHGSDAAQLKHMNVAGEGEESIGALAGEIRRTIASLPKNGSPMAMMLWNSGTSENSRGVLEQRLSMPVKTAQLRSLATTDAAGGDAYAAAVALALIAFDPAGLPVDFLNSRLAPPKAPAISMQRKLAMTGITVAVVLIGAGFYHLNSKWTELDAIQNQSNKRAAQVKLAQGEIQRYKDAEKWIPKGPHLVAVLRDLTTDFTRTPNTIWATRLNNLPDGWELDGQAMTDQLVRDLMTTLLADNRFSQPVNTFLAQDVSSGLWTFKIKFAYNGADGAGK